MNLFKRLIVKAKDFFILEMKPITMAGILFLVVGFPLTNFFNELMDWFSNHPVFQNFKLGIELSGPILTKEMVSFILATLGVLFLCFLLLTLLQYFFSAIFLSIIHKTEHNLLKMAKNIFRRIPQLIGFILLESLFTIIGFILFIIPGIFVYFVFYFAFTIMITENKGVFSSVAKAFMFLKSRFWKVVPTILALKIIILIAHPLTEWIGLGGVALVANLFLSSFFAYQMLYSEQPHPTTSAN